MKILNKFRNLKSATGLKAGSAKPIRNLLYVLITLAFLTASCNEKPLPYSILEFSGKVTVMNYSKSPLLMLYESDSINSTALLAGSGDLLLLDENRIFYYTDPGEKKFVYKTTDTADYLNGKIISINIQKKTDMISWFERMKSEDYSKLGMIRIDTLIPDSYLPYLSDLAKKKPGIGLAYNEGDLKEISNFLKMFNPRLIMGGDVSQNDFNILSGLNNLELLGISIDDSVCTASLPAMPKLKQLILEDISKGTLLNRNLFSNNKQIEKLIIMNSEYFDFNILDPLINLKELIINGPDTLDNTELIKKQKNLEFLSVNGKHIRMGNSLYELKKLRWFTFSSNTTQEDFDSFIDSHPDLEVADIIQNDTIANLQRLLKLKKLYGLSVTDTLTDYATIKSLKNLKYLSLPDKVMEDKITKEELKKLLPETRIVANQGFCLGSGWLLLIIPLTIILSLFFNAKGAKF